MALSRIEREASLALRPRVVGRDKRTTRRDSLLIKVRTALITWISLLLTDADSPNSSLFSANPYNARNRGTGLPATIAEPVSVRSCTQYVVLAVALGCPDFTRACVPSGSSGSGGEKSCSTAIPLITKRPACEHWTFVSVVPAARKRMWFAQSQPCCPKNTEKPVLLAFGCMGDGTNTSRSHRARAAEWNLQNSGNLVKQFPVTTGLGCPQLQSHSCSAGAPRNATDLKQRSKREPHRCVRIFDSGSMAVIRIQNLVSWQRVS